MNKLLIALIAGAFTSITAAQAASLYPTTIERRAYVETLTLQSLDNSVNTQATAAEQARSVQASKAATKLSKAEKVQLAKESTRLNVNPESSAGTAETADMQQQTTRISKATQRQNVDLRSKAGKELLYRELRNSSTV